MLSNFDDREADIVGWKESTGRPAGNDHASFCRVYWTIEAVNNLADELKLRLSKICGYSAPEPPSLVPFPSVQEISTATRDSQAWTPRMDVSKFSRAFSLKVDLDLSHMASQKRTKNAPNVA